jgi:hypothetical protein
MAFTLEMENPVVVSILNSLEAMCSILPFEVDEHGLGLNVASDGRDTAIILKFDKDMFKDFVFQGDGKEGICVNSANFKKIMSKLAYPVSMEYGLSGGIKISSTIGRQNYTVRAVEEVISEKAYEAAGRIYEQLQKHISSGEQLIAKVLAQDFKMALNNVDVMAKAEKTNVEITLNGDTLDFVVDSVDIDAEAIVPLVEAVDGEWTRVYNLGFLKNIIGIVSRNVEIKVHLFDDTRSIMFEMPLDDESKSFCLVNLAPVEMRRGRESAEVEDDEEEDEPDEE